jgi:hypothetical protein
MDATPAETKRSDLSQDAIGNDTYFIVWCRVPGQIRLFQVYDEMIETKEEVLQVVSELPDSWSVACIFRHDYDIPRKDVTEDIAHLAWQRWKTDNDNSIGGAPVPDFVMQHAPIDCDVGYRPGQDDSDDARASKGAWAVAESEKVMG